jgi:hypothetical protein
MGDKQGHEFRGNQWTSARTGGRAAAAAVVKKGDWSEGSRSGRAALAGSHEESYVAPGRSRAGDGDGRDPAGGRATFKPEAGGRLYHGSRDTGDFKGGELYLVDHYDEAVGYAEGKALTGHGPESDAHVATVSLPRGKAVDINDEVNEAIMEGDDLEAALATGFARARAAGALYATYTHPSFSSDREQNVTVLLDPKKAKRVGGWYLRGEK